MVWTAAAGHGADVVVLVHGSMDRSAGLLKLSRRLDDRFRVVRYDRRGYGRSTPHDGPFEMPDQVDDLRQVILEAEPERCVVIGHSYGGNVALSLADHHPDLVDAVVTYESPLSWLPWWGGSAGSSAMEARDDPAAAAERFMRSLIGDERWERLPSGTRAARRAEGAAMLGELADLRATPPWRPDRVTVPVLVLFGEHGRPHHRRGAEHLADMLPDARLEMVPEAKHFGPNTHPDDVAERVLRFIDASG